MERGDAIRVADVIISQLGGLNKLQAMVHAQNIYPHEEGGVSFKFSGNRKINYCKITLNGNDTYDIEFKKVNNLTSKSISTHTDVYNGQLKPLFEYETGLYLSLF